MKIKQIITIIVAAILFLLPFILGCQVDHQVNSSMRFLMDGEGPESRQTWAFGNLK